MKITHIITGLNNGGAEAVLYRLIYHDQENTHIVISMMGEGKYSNPLHAIGVKIHYINMPRGKLTYKGIINLWKIIKNTNSDIIQTWMYHADLIGGTLAKLQGASKIIWGIRNSDLSSQTTTLSTRIVARLCAILSHTIPTTIISCSEQAAKSHQKIGYIKKKFTVIPNGYDFKLFAPNSVNCKLLLDELHIQKDKIVLGMIGRFNPHKNHRNLINTLSILKNRKIDFLCLLVGSGMSYTNKELKTWIEQADLAEQVLLLEQRNDIPNIMNILDLHILSSIGEAFPNVLAEAMSCGTPCITTNVGDASLIVGNTGWVVPISNSSALADAILTAIQEKEQDPDAWHARKQAARQRIIDNFSIERMVAAYNNVWSEAKK